MIEKETYRVRGEWPDYVESEYPRGDQHQKRQGWLAEVSKRSGSKGFINMYWGITHFQALKRKDVADKAARAMLDLGFKKVKLTTIYHRETTEDLN